MSEFGTAEFGTAEFGTASIVITKPTVSRVGTNLQAASQITGLLTGDTVGFFYRDINADTSGDTIKPDTPGQAIWKPMTLQGS